MEITVKPDLRYFPLPLSLLLLVVCAAPAQVNTRVLIDADTANEVDDPYAIVRALVEPGLDVRGLSSAQWQSSHWATPNTLEDSQRLNEMLLAFLRMSAVPHPRGAQNRIYDWGQDVAQHSAAAYHLISEANKVAGPGKLNVIVLGAWTNVASALLIEPAIAPTLRLYLLGTSHDFEKGIWKKTDFNCINDPHAVNVVLDNGELETHIMPVNVAAAMTFQMQDFRRAFAGGNEVLDFLYQRWVHHIDEGRYSRIIWDLSLVEAFLHPEWASEVSVSTPPENTTRQVFVYQRINASAMRNDFYTALQRHFQTEK
jgi:inosine-uridine nucleoside N-ribohydrolase